MNDNMVSGKTNFRDEFRLMLESIHHPFEYCKEVLRQSESPVSNLTNPDIKLDPGFKPFYYWCKENGVPVIIVSSGMAPIIRAVLENLMGDEAANIEIIANDVRYTDPEQKGDTWEIVFRHPESGFGHDKSQSIIPYRNIPSTPTIFFAGDGVSDLSAARHADLLFTKVTAEGNTDLLQYCINEGIPHVPFSHFDTVLEKVKLVVGGQKTTQQIIQEAEDVQPSN